MLGMSDEAVREWVAGFDAKRAARWLARLVPWPRTPQSPHGRRPGNFICDKHWAQITATWESDRPASATSVTTGLMVGLYLMNFPPAPVRHACCLLNEHGWRGILERSRTPISEAPRRIA